MIKSRISRLRDWMVRHQLSAFIIPSADPHLGEYIAPRWKSREWISGFTGSAGTVVITLEKGGLWTDSRYFIQAEAQLQGSGIELYKSSQREMSGEIPNWLLQELPEDSRVGIDGHLLTQVEAETLENSLSAKHIALVTEKEPMGEIWEDRPSFPANPIEIYDAKYTGQSASERLSLLRQELGKLDADSLFVTPLDEIAWVLLIRGTDVQYNPVAISYLLVTAEEAILFIDPSKCPKEVVEHLKNEGIQTCPYTEALPTLRSLQNHRLLMPSGKTSVASYKAASESGCTLLSADSPLSWMKCIRTETEIEGLRQCMIYDGVALVKFQRWLTDAVQCGEKITEIGLDRKLYEFRAEQPLFRGESFATIAGYGAHAASPHYCATPETNATLEARGYLLLDSGGQYLNGTTDITRTIVLGPLTEDEKIDYTCVLRGHINLASVKFPKGTNGTQLDALARAPLWERGMQFLHGTGHGVGHYLNVHEGTDVYQFRMSYMPHPLMLHSNITNEPALYKPGSHGTRTENMMLVCHDQITEFGEFYRFETLTLCPIDTEAIIKSMLTPHEIHWLNTYHEQVYDRLSPYLNNEEQEWLRDKCTAI